VLQYACAQTQLQQKITAAADTAGAATKVVQEACTTNANGVSALESSNMVCVCVWMFVFVRACVCVHTGV